MKNLILLPLAATSLIILSACGSSESPKEFNTQRLVGIANNWSGGLVELTRIEYTESGNLLRDTVTANGEIVRTRTFETTDEGQLIRRSDDTDQDGIEDSASTYVYMDGFGLTRNNSIGANGLIESIAVFQFEDGQAYQLKYGILKMLQRQI